MLRGHTRANAGGLDLNRCYGDANPGDHEGTEQPKKTAVERLCGWVSCGWFVKWVFLSRIFVSFFLFLWTSSKFSCDDYPVSGQMQNSAVKYWIECHTLQGRSPYPPPQTGKGKSSTQKWFLMGYISSKEGIVWGNRKKLKDMVAKSYVVLIFMLPKRWFCASSKLNDHVDWSSFTFMVGS